MPCSSCGRSQIQFNTLSPTIIQCDYTQEVMIDWKNKLDCIKNNSKLSEIGLTDKDYNRFMGLILSGINFEYNICFFKDRLDLLLPYILKIIILNIC